MGGCRGSVAEKLGLSLDPVREALESVARAVLGCEPAHGWPHVVRVAGWAARIVEAEGLEPDWDVLHAAVTLHDVGRAVDWERHAVESARVARALLPATPLAGKVEGVVHAILAHSYSLGVRAETVEARVLSDADKLDALGAVGVARVFATGARLGRGFQGDLDHVREKILGLPKLMYYGWSRRVAERLAATVQAFLEAWASEERLREGSGG